MKNDISTRSDIDHLVKTFYEKLLNNDLLKHIFESTIVNHFDTHIKTIADFWDSILLDGNVYRGNVTEKHIALDVLFPLNGEEFETWLSIWKSTVDELFEGEKAEMAKFRAQSIADIMQYKIDYVRRSRQS
jgi:hemoglobin